MNFIFSLHKKQKKRDSKSLIQNQLNLWMNLNISKILYLSVIHYYNRFKKSKYHSKEEGKLEKLKKLYNHKI